MIAAEAPEADDAQLTLIATLCDGGATFCSEGWRKLILMRGLRFYAAGHEQKMDAVLCLNHDNPTYPTKLYLAQKVGGVLNWNETAYLLGRQWHTFSWRDVSPHQPYFEILAEHLAPLKSGGKP